MAITNGCKWVRWKSVCGIVSKMNVGNEMKIEGLMIYKVIEVSENSLIRIS